MKKAICLLFLTFSVMVFSQFNLPAGSPRQKIEQQFSLTKITVDYGRPGVRGRKVFGELVPFGKVWRAGANSSTKITFAQNVDFGGTTVKAGTYALFILPEPSEWKIILNKDSQQWGAFSYDEKLNIAIVTRPVRQLSDKQEWFEISLDPIDSHAINLKIKWDHAEITVPIKEAKPETILKITEKLTEIRELEKNASK